MGSHSRFILSDSLGVFLEGGATPNRYPSKDLNIFSFYRLNDGMTDLGFEL